MHDQKVVDLRINYHRKGMSSNGKVLTLSSDQGILLKSLPRPRHRHVGSSDPDFSSVFISLDASQISEQTSQSRCRLKCPNHPAHRETGPTTYGQLCRLCILYGAGMAYLSRNRPFYISLRSTIHVKPIYSAAPLPILSFHRNIMTGPSSTHEERTAASQRDSDLHQVRIANIEQVNESVRLLRLAIPPSQQVKARLCPSNPSLI